MVLQKVRAVKKKFLMVNALLLTEDTFRTGKLLCLSKDCFKIARGLWSMQYFWAKKGCLFTQAETVQRRCEEATGQLGCHMSTASDLSSLL